MKSFKKRWRERCLPSVHMWVCPMFQSHNTMMPLDSRLFIRLFALD